MFEDSLIESGGKLKDKRAITTTISFIFQLCLIAFLVLVPLLYTEALPKAQLMTFLVAPPPPAPPAAAVKVVHVVQTNLDEGRLRTPTKIPTKIEMIAEEAPAISGVVGDVPGGIPGGTPNGVMRSIISSTLPAVPKVAKPTRVRVSQGVTQGLLLRKVNPTYPALARAARVQGSVLLQAEISKTGDIENLHLISGHPMLAPAAIEAVKQWKYKPYVLNGEPVDVETQITVNFTLSGG